MGAPSLIDAQGDQILGFLNASMAFHYNHVLAGAAVDGGSAQASGASGALTLDLDSAQIVDAVVQGTAVELAAQTSFTPDASGVIWGATSGKSVIYALVLDADATVQLNGLFGAVADDGSEVAPSDAEISEALGHDNWVRMADVTIQRTGDTALSLSVDHTVRPSVTGWASLILTEEDFRAESANP